MNRFRLLLLSVVIFLPSLAAAQVIKFEEAAAMLAASCGKDLDDNCRGVNFDAGRLKDCLVRNQDVVSAKCQADYPRAFAALQARISARAAVTKQCQRDADKFCAEEQKEGRSLQCLIAGPRGVSANCNRALSAGGYR
ncbi:hypothetical protein [Bradyrhizobium sp.]|uniref:hypothetical protein n=1 Tax=Bradyrhizobium sp. TaxID=376 RepID=UPI0025BF459F|nr:hypothetical protein [Bradyrhizobium sp.]